MTYTDEELQILHEENERYQELMNDVYLGSLQPASLIDLKAGDNDVKFYEIFEVLIDKGKNLSMEFKNDSGLPYYRIKVSDERSLTIYLNKEIIQYFYSYIKDGTVLPKTPNLWDIQKNANENYMLHLMKRDRENGALRLSQTTNEYKANYPKGTVHYGELAYTTDELIAKFASLP